jgi:hypothetical protein
MDRYNHIITLRNINYEARRKGMIPPNRAQQREEIRAAYQRELEEHQNDPLFMDTSSESDLQPSDPEDLDEPAKMGLHGGGHWSRSSSSESSS